MKNEKKLSLLFIIDQLSSGGAQRQMALLGCELVKLGHKVLILVYRHNDFHSETLERAGVKVELIPKKSKFSTAFVRGVAKKLRVENFDAMVSYLTASNLYAIFGKWLSRKKIPLIVSERSSPNNPNYGRTSRLIERLYRFADGLVVNSHHLREYFETKYPWCRDRVTTIWNGVDLNKFSATPLPGKNGLPQFVAVGQIGRFKQAECMIRALGILKERHSLAVHLTWYARRFPNLMPSEAEYKKHLDQLIMERSLDDQWHWIPESKSIHLEIQKYHCLIHGSIVEGLPNAICEALASGRPVIASKTLDHPKLIQPGQNGFLFEKQNPESLAEVIHAFCKLSDEQRRAMGSAAADFAKAELSPDVFARHYQSMLLDLVSKKVDG